MALNANDAQIIRLGVYIGQLENALQECNKQNQEKAKEIVQLKAEAEEVEYAADQAAGDMLPAEEN